jgi:small GTP-binding protein
MITLSSLWQRVRRTFDPNDAAASARMDVGDVHGTQATESLRALLDDPQIPGAIRTGLAAEFARLEAMLGKLERGELHIAVFGRVSVGKSALANALLGEDAFTVGVLHGTTREAGQRRWQQVAGSGVHLIDTPGIDELDGEARERLAYDVAGVSDLVVFVVDGDMTQRERDALALLARTERPLLLALNKADRYGEDERERLIERLREHARGLVRAEDVVAVSARPAPQKRIRVEADGNERIELVEVPADIAALRDRLSVIIEREGKTLAALNASLFAGRLSDQVGAPQRDGHGVFLDREGVGDADRFERGHGFGPRAQVGEGRRVGAHGCAGGHGLGGLSVVDRHVELGVSLSRERP